MTLTSSVARMSLTYPTARVRGRIITRLEERSIGWTVLDAGTADVLGREHLGWFVGNYFGLARAAQQLGRLDTNPEGGTWVVVPLGRDLARGLFAEWPHPEYVTSLPDSGNSVWRSRKVWVA